MQLDIVSALTGGEGQAYGAEYFSTLRKEMQILFAMPEDGDLNPFSTLDKTKMFISSILQFGGGWSDALKARAIRNSGVLLDNSGNIITNYVNEVDAWPKLFGAKTEQEINYSAIFSGTAKNQGNTDDIRKAAEDTVKNLNRLFRLHGGMTDEFKRQAMFYNMQWNFFDDEERVAFTRYLTEAWTSTKNEQSRDMNLRDWVVGKFWTREESLEEIEKRMRAISDPALLEDLRAIYLDLKADSERTN
jgi:hypothetical protein